MKNRKIKFPISNFQLNKSGLAPIEIIRPWANVKSLSGFTLIELMVVIAIIGILASIMIPNLVKNVERGREARAAADIDILVKAVNLSQIDNGVIPTDLSQLWSPTGGGPYISSENSLKTPWGGTYVITLGTGSYTIATTDIDKENKPKASKIIKFE